jgi:vibriolysin
MTYLKNVLLVFACSLLAFGQDFSQPTEPSKTDYEPLFLVGQGERVFHQGKFGNINGQGMAAQLLEDFSPLKGANVDLVEVRDKTDRLGKRHVRVQQYINGREVVGGEMIVHADVNGDVYAVNGRFGNSERAAVNPTVNSKKAIARGLSMANIRTSSQQGPAKLAYVVDEDGEVFLAWEAMVSYDNQEGPQRDRIFADASGGNRLVRHPQHHYARNRRTYTANNGTSLPGSLVRTEGSGNSGDAALDAAHNNAGTTYDYYNTKYGRDSYNNNGATLHSTVHYRTNYNNAFWNGSQMVYGDGDGVTFSPLSQSLDVVAHELTHAVTSSESNLIYQNESGALNEAMSDIMGASTEAWDDGFVSSNTWLLGEDIYTPGTPGDALRTMADPAASGDRDYYPDRYTGSADNGGVHTNSGIANLAFVLLVQGGTHPRGKTSNNVPGIGISKAEQIFYRANTVYLTSGSDFEDCRNATANAADDLYGQTEVDAVHEAWDAVGVPGGGGGGGGGCSGYAETFTGSLSSGGQAFQPNGTYWYDSNGDTSCSLSSSATDFDVYLWKWTGSWTTVASGTSPNSSETINYNGSSGYYVYRVHAYSGSGSYTLCVNR